MNKCKICGNETKNKKYCSLECRYKDSYFKNHTWNKGVKNCFSNETKKKISDSLKGKSPWNKGLTKEDNLSLMNISNNMKGKNNCVYKIVNDKEKKQKWIHNIKKSNKRHYDYKRGKKLEQILGDEKSAKAKNKMSISAKNRLINGHTGIKHNKEQRERISIGIRNAYKNGKILRNSSKPEHEFYLFIKKYINNVFHRKQISGYEVDLFIEPNICIEFDGDYWHANPAFLKKKNMKINGIQKHNLIMQKKKQLILESLGYKIIRVWESDFYKDKDSILKRILNEIKI